MSAEVIQTVLIIGGFKAVAHLSVYAKQLYYRKEGDMPSTQDIGMSVILAVLGALILMSNGGKKFVLPYLAFMIGTIISLQYPAMHNGTDVHTISVILLALGTLTYLAGLYGIKKQGDVTQGLL